MKRNHRLAALNGSDKKQICDLLEFNPLKYGGHNKIRRQEWTNQSINYVSKVHSSNNSKHVLIEVGKIVTYV